MSKVQQNYSWPKTKVNSAKTAFAQAELEIPHYKEHMAKFEEQLNLKSYAQRTVFSYSRAIATIILSKRGKALSIMF